MKITPLDIRQKRFESSFRGFGRREVEAFLDFVATEFEDVVKDNIGLKEELKRASLRLEQYQERERTLQETMITAQRISEDLKEAAKKEAEIILADAEQQAERIVQDAHLKLVQVVSDINELKRQRAQFESQVGSIIAAHKKLLETFAGDPGPDPSRIEDNVSFFTPKKATSGE